MCVHECRSLQVAGSKEPKLMASWPVTTKVEEYVTTEAEARTGSYTVPERVASRDVRDRVHPSRPFQNVPSCVGKSHKIPPKSGVGVWLAWLGFFGTSMEVHSHRLIIVRTPGSTPEHSVPVLFSPVRSCPVSGAPGSTREHPGAPGSILFGSTSMYEYIADRSLSAMQHVISMSMSVSLVNKSPD